MSQFNHQTFPLLSTVNNPSQLRQLPETELPQLVIELREYLLQTLNQCGGHFAGNLGTIELTIALHYVFNTPDDRLIWDVGHQAYPHKILTERREQLATIRQTKGLAPFPSREESIYDVFGVGHSSTSISAALGISLAQQLKNSNQKTVAIIGDGAMTAGMAFEALNHAGDIRPNLLVILNDNEMSISGNVGALSQYFARVLSGKFYTSMRENSKKVLKKIPPVLELARRTEEHFKGMLIPGTLFEELGFNYIGPIDGHDLDVLIPTLRNLRELNGPQLLHVVTKKGKGYAPAEADPIKYHAVTPGFLNTTAAPAAANKKITYSNVFGEWLCDMAAIDPRLIGITPAMREGSDLIQFSKSYPERYFDVGIAEQHAVTLAAGLACENQKPVVAIYSSFLQRAYDQLIHDVAIQNLPVLFALDRSGLVGGDGATHNGSFDLSYLRCIPNLVIMTASSGNELRQMLFTAFQHNGPTAVRYPRGTITDAPLEKQMTTIPLGKAEIKRQGKKVVLLAFGSMVAPALIVGETLDATVINMRFVKPLDTVLIQALAQEYQLVVTIEENAIMGGAGSAVSEYLNATGISHNLLQLGLPDYFVEHGDQQKLLADYGLDANGILKAVEQRLSLI